MGVSGEHTITSVPVIIVALPRIDVPLPVVSVPVHVDHAACDSRT
jgi:hypothetical protein